MNYKELIGKLNFWADVFLINNMGECQELVKDATTAIEALLAERDAAVADMQRNCITCTHSESNNDKHIPCEFMEACRFAEHWEWRGLHYN